MAGRGNHFMHQESVVKTCQGHFHSQVATPPNGQPAFQSGSIPYLT